MDIQALIEAELARAGGTPPGAADPNSPVRRIPGDRPRGYVHQPGAPESSDGYYDMAPDQLAQLPPEVLLMLGLTTDMNNANPNIPPMRSEDDMNGYWDAQNMGNGRGNSFVMENGQQRMADPVGNPAVIEELLSLIGPSGGQAAADMPDEGLMELARAAWEDENGPAKTPDDEAAIAEMAGWILEQTGGDPEAIAQFMSQR